MEHPCMKGEKNPPNFINRHENNIYPSLSQIVLQSVQQVSTITAVAPVDSTTTVNNTATTVATNNNYVSQRYNPRASLTHSSEWPASWEEPRSEILVSLVREQSCMLATMSYCSIRVCVSVCVGGTRRPDCALHPTPKYVRERERTNCGYLTSRKSV